MSKYKAQLAAVRLALAKDQEALENLGAEVMAAEAQYLSDWKQSDHLLGQIEAYLTKERQDEDSRRARTFLGFFKIKPPIEGPRRLDVLQSERCKLLDRMGSAAAVIEQKRSLVASTEDGKEAVDRLEACVAAEAERNERLATSAQRRHTREQTTKAKAAAHDGNSRELAAQVKKRIDRQAYCPYCGDTLGFDAHADHIYPVSKGGLSTPRNLVFACGPCNMRKRDMTLASFVRVFGLNREEIESRLTGLGKDF